MYGYVCRRYEEFDDSAGICNDKVSYCDDLEQSKDVVLVG